MKLAGVMGDYQAVESARRIEWIDIAKGIAILLVVLGHCHQSMVEPANRFILSFHMPLFFFLSGFCAKKIVEPFAIFAKKRAYGLLIPQVTLAISCGIYDFLSGNIALTDIWQELCIWFLPVLFMCNLLFWVFYRIFKSDIVKWFFLLRWF